MSFRNVLLEPDELVVAGLARWTFRRRDLSGPVCRRPPRTPGHAAGGRFRPLTPWTGRIRPARRGFLGQPGLPPQSGKLLAQLPQQYRDGI